MNKGFTKHDVMRFMWAFLSKVSREIDKYPPDELDKAMSRQAVIFETTCDDPSVGKYIDALRRTIRENVDGMGVADICRQLSERIQMRLLEIEEKQADEQFLREQRDFDRDEIRKVAGKLEELKQDYLDNYGLDRWYASIFEDEDNDD